MSFMSFMPTIMLICSLPIALFLAANVEAVPFSAPPAHRYRPISLPTRTEQPYFPDSPVSCQKCEANYSNIQNCAEAAPVLANFSMIIFNPGAFVNIIQCACTETFQAVFPQCVDCFEATNQTDVLVSSDLPSIVSGMRTICALESTLLGGVASANGETTLTAAAPTSSSGALSNIRARSTAGLYAGSAVLIVIGMSSTLVI